MQSKAISDDTTNPLKIRILIESYEKEAYLRSLWNRKYEDIIKDAATLKRESKNYYETDILAYLMKEGMPALTRDYVASGYHRNRILEDYEIPGIKHLRHGHSIVDLGLGDPSKDPRIKRSIEDLSPDPLMRPVPSPIKNILFECEPSSRKRYLNQRWKSAPEEKYYFPETTSWDYGWRLEDNTMKSGRRYSKSGEFMKSLQNRVGAIPDPTHYEACASNDKVCYF